MAIFVNRWPRSLPVLEVVDGVDVHRLPFRVPDVSVKSRISQAATRLAVDRRLRLLLSKFRPDVLHVQCISSNGEYARRAADALGLPLVVTTHAEITMDTDRLYQRSRRANLQLQHLLAAADEVTAVSSNTLEDLREHAKQPLTHARVVANGARIAEFQEAVPYRHRRPYFLAIGRLVPEKGFDVLLTALHAAGIDHDLLIAGTGPQQDALRDQAASLGLDDRVTFVGRADRGLVSSLHAGSDFFVLPSTAQEGLPLVALEAMAAGNAILATRSGGLPEVLEDESSALFVERGDVTALAQGLVRLAGDVDLRRRLGATAAAAARAFDWDAIASEYLEVFTSAARRRGGR